MPKKCAKTILILLLCTPLSGLDVVASHILGMPSTSQQPCYGELRLSSTPLVTTITSTMPAPHNIINDTDMVINHNNMVINPHNNNHSVPLHSISNFINNQTNITQNVDQAHDQEQSLQQEVNIATDIESVTHTRSETVDNNNEHESESENIDEHLQANLSWLLQEVAGIYAKVAEYTIPIFLLVSFLSPIIFESYNIYLGDTIQNIRTNNQTMFGERLSDFYYESTCETGSTTSSADEVGFIEDLFFSFMDSVSLRMAISLMSNMLGIVFNPMIDWLSSSSITAYIPSQWIDFTKNITPAVNYILSGSIMEKYTSRFGLMPAPYLNTTKGEHYAQSTIIGNASKKTTTDSRYCVVKVYPYQQLLINSTIQLVIRTVSNCLSACLLVSHGMCEVFITNIAIATAQIVGDFVAVSYINPDKVCQNAFASNYSDFAKQCRQNGVKDCCALFMETLGASKIKSTKVITWVYVGSIATVILNITSIYGIIAYVVTTILS